MPGNQSARLLAKRGKAVHNVWAGCAKGWDKRLHLPTAAYAPFWQWV